MKKELVYVLIAKKFNLKFNKRYLIWKIKKLRLTMALYQLLFCYKKILQIFHRIYH